MLESCKCYREKIKPESEIGSRGRGFDFIEWSEKTSLRGWHFSKGSKLCRYLGETLQKEGKAGAKTWQQEYVLHI